MDISASPARHLHIRKRFGASEVEPDFSRMCSEGFSFYWVCGWRRVRSTPLLRPQPPATVRNRSQPFATVCNEVAMAVPIVSSAKGINFGGFHRRVASFREVVWCNTFASFSEVNLQFLRQAHHFGRVVLRVFYDSIVRAARSGYKV